MLKYRVILEMEAELLQGSAGVSAYRDTVSYAMTTSCPVTRFPLHLLVASYKSSESSIFIMFVNV